VTTPLRTRILLADDHGLVRRGLRLVLDAQPDLEVVCEAADGREALALALGEPVHLAILDVAMPEMSGLEVAAQITRQRPEVRVLMLSVHDDEHYLYEALRAGASGYVLKASASKDLVEACRATMRGEPFLYPAAVAGLVRDFLEQASHGDDEPREALTPREMEVVKLIAEAHSTDEIAAILNISPKTVERHRGNILSKLEMRDRVEVTRYAIRRGLVEP
jgi:DNA-binding NarL/FixJ family response regulator